MSRKRNNSLEPIPLTNQQIQEILDIIPLPAGRGTTAVEAAHFDNLEKLRLNLNQVKLVPDDSVFQEFKMVIRNTFISSGVEMFAPVGINASMSVSAPITQSSLNSFHAAGGDSGIAEFFAQLKSFLAVSKTDKHERCIIMPQNRTIKTPSVDILSARHLNSGKAIYAEMRGDIEETTTNGIISAESYINGETDEQFLEILKNFKKKFPSFLKGRTAEYSNVLRIDLDVSRMFSHKVLIGHVIYAWTRQLDASKLAGVRFVWGPTHTGSIYVIYSREIVPNMHLENVSENNVSSAFRAFSAHLEDINPHIMGIPSISRMRIDTQPVSRVIGRYVADGHTHRLYINDQQTRFAGGSLRDLHFITKWSPIPKSTADNGTWEDVGISAEMWPTIKYAIVTTQNLNILLKNHDITYEIYEYETWLIKGDISKIPHNLLETVYIKHADIDDVTMDLEEKCLVIQVSNPRVDIAKRVKKFSESAFADGRVARIVVRGDFNEILRYEGPVLFDMTRTYPNFHHPVIRLMGIQCAVYYMIVVFYNMLVESGSSLNIRHLELIFSFMAQEGYMIPLNFHGVKKLNDPLTSASHERALEVSANAAFDGIVMNVDRVSASIYVGQQIQQGTGAVIMEVGNYNSFVQEDNIYNFTIEPISATNYAGVPTFDVKPITYSIEVPPTELADQLKIYAGTNSIYNPDFDLVF